MDVVWAFLSNVSTVGGCRLKFADLSKVARFVLVLPHMSHDHCVSVISQHPYPLHVRGSYRAETGHQGN